MRLIRFECKRICKSLVYLLFILLLVANWNQNFAGITADEIGKAEGTRSTTELIQFDRPVLKEPSAEDEFYGSKYVENSIKIMRGATDKLLSEYKANLYATYPLGYYKAVSLDKKDQEKVLSILCEITGLTEEHLMDLPDNYFPSVNGTIIHMPADEADQGKEADRNITIPVEEEKTENTDKTKVFISQISYDTFKMRMLELEKMIGRRSNYSMEMLVSYYGMEEMTYEEAVEEFDATINKDHLSSGFARLFCDSMASIVGLLPTFLMVFLWMCDMTSKSNELIYERKISSAKIVCFRFLACVVMVMIPILLLTLESFFPLLGFSYNNGYSMDYLAYIKYSIYWLMPTIMISLALGSLLTVLTDSPVAVLIQLVWWFIERGITGLSGDTGIFTLMIRHNTLRGYEIIREQANIIFANRLIYVLLSFGLLWLTSLALEKKRRGKFDCRNFYTKCFRAVKAKFQTCHS